MPMDRQNPHLSRGYAYVEFETPEEAQKALKYMDGGTPDWLLQRLCLGSLQIILGLLRAHLNMCLML